MFMTAILTTFLAAGQEALGLIGRAVLPVLFPFFVLTTLILNLSRTNNKYVVAGLAYFSGYPNGTRLAKLLYERGDLTAAAARHLSILTSTPSPIFIIATVGTIFLQSTRTGLAIFFCAVGGAIINSLIWRPGQTTPSPITNLPKPPPPPSFLKAFNDAVYSATSAIINVCGIILFFFILTKLLHLPAALAGLLEMTTGVAQTTNPLLIQFLVCFGGLSVAVQNLLFAESFHLKFGYYLAYKFTHGVLACGLLTLYLLFC